MYTYTNKALIGNWYEDRLDQSHAPIPEFERTGKYRVTPLKMIEPSAELYKTTNVLYHGPQHAIVEPVKPQFISKSTLATALHTRMPPEEFPQQGFGSVLPKHEKGHDHRRFETTTHSTYGGKYADSVDRRKDVDPNLLQVQQSKPAGKVFKNFAAGGLRTGGATDERLQLGESDPKSHSFIQRAWVGHTGFQEHVLRSDEYEKANAAIKNIDGVALKGLGEQRTIDYSQVSHEKKFFKKNDTLRRDVGIWSE